MQRALDHTRELALRLAIDEAIPPDGVLEGEGLDLWLRAALNVTRRQISLAESSMAGTTSIAAFDPTEEAEAWRQLDDACRRLEQELAAPATLQSRLEQGRRSMTPRVEKLLRGRLVPTVSTQGRRLTAKMDAERFTELQQEFPGWIKAWGQFAYTWLEMDQQRLMQRLWNPRERDLPVKAPEFPPLSLPGFEARIEFPEVSLERGGLSLSGRMMKHGRTVLYGILSLAVLVGLSPGRQADMPTWVWPVLLTVGLSAAVAIGYLQAQGERNVQRERLAAEVRHRAEQATREALRAWLDRCHDKLRDDALAQLGQRHEALVAWYRKEVRPERRRWEAMRRESAAAAADARRNLFHQQDRLRELKVLLGRLTGIERGLKDLTVG